MVDSIVSLAIERISDVLIQEVVFLHGVEEEVERLKAELIRMRCFLKDADGKQEQNERVRNWVAEIRDLAYDAEVVIDTFILRVASSGGAGLHGIIKKFACFFTKTSHLHKMGTQIQTIRTKLEDISRGLQTYGIGFEGEASSSTQQELRRSYPHFEEDDVVGLVDSTKEVMDELLAEDDLEQLHCVSIVGMGGIGKTTIAKKVYNSIQVKRRFDCSGWAFISQQCFVGNVLRKILIEVGEDKEVIDKLKEEDLCERLYNFLKEKCYLVVLDDIWKNEHWDKIKQAFPKGKKGSKILFTTRKREVVLHADPHSSVIETQFLTSDESWELLKRRVWRSHECPIEFETLGREMVKKCSGLPLAVVVLGGLLAAKDSLEDWEKVSRSIHASMSKFQEEDHPYSTVNGILALSYNELPYHLKPCFLYLGHYPEDSEISVKKLIRLWIAEGFISPSMEGAELLMEDVANQYLEKLINRSLVQVEKRDHTGKGVKSCRIHDLLRDLCVSKAIDEKFMGIIPSSKTENEDFLCRLSGSTSSNKPRRISCHGGRSPDAFPEKPNVNMYIYDDMDKRCSKVRSILFCQDEVCVKLSMPNAFKLLRVLNLLGTNKLGWRGRWRVPTEIGNLIHLRYLALKCQHVILPPSIGNLKNLQTLYVRYRLKVPNVLFKLKSLRHLSMGDFLEGPVRIDTLENIVTLKRIPAGFLIKNNAMLTLTKIQSLGIEFCTPEEFEVILKSNLFQCNRLRSLYMVLYQSISNANLGPLSDCHQLSKLRIFGKIPEDLNSGHRVFEFLPEKISSLDLENSQLKHDPMPSLEKLPQLRILKLGSIDSYMGSKMVCSANGFRQLEYLSLDSLRELEEWEIQEDAMPRLKTLCLSGLSKLQMVPEGLRYVKSLHKLELVFMQSSFVERIQVIDGREGEDFYKVCHIPSISVKLYQPPAAL